MRIIPFLLLLSCSFAFGQTDYKADAVARDIPTAQTRSVKQIADYFVKNIPDERGRIRAIFAWITLNIKYLNKSDDAEIWASPEHMNRQRPEQVLINRSAVCQGYANLFHALAKAAGIESAGLDPEFCATMLYNLHQEVYTLSFNRSSLYFRAAMDMYRDAVEQNLLSNKKTAIEAPAQQALSSLKTTSQSLEYLQSSRLRSANALAGRKQQVDHLLKSIRSFLDAL